MQLFVLVLLGVSSIWAHPQVRSPKGTRIIGGEVAYAGQYPYAAAIYTITPTGNFFCMGTIISSEWILTSGTCVDGVSSFTIILGTTKLDENDAETVRVATDTYILHPDYNRETLDNDIGLIRLRLAITYSPYIKQLYLPYADLGDGGVAATGYGWGLTSDEDTDLANELHYVILTSVSNAECRITYGNQLTSNMVCFAGNYNEGTCIGDVGSPLMQDISRGYSIVIALSSFISANGCESTDPSGYTKIFPYNDWIRNVSGAG